MARLAGLRKLGKYMLPAGAIEIVRNRRRLAQIGIRTSIRDLWRSDWLVHEAETSGLALFPPHRPPDLHTVIDAGANIGQWSTMLLDLFRPNKLIMIEPLPSAFARLQERFASRGGVELHNVAIGATDGTTTLRVTADTTGASVLVPRSEMTELVGSNWRVEEEIQVPMRRLDTLLNQLSEISLLKIDVQGFEKEALSGAIETLGRTNYLLIELNYMPQYVGGSWFGEIHEILTRECGFVLLNVSRPLCLNGRASMSDGLYVNPRRVADFARRDFV